MAPPRRVNSSHVKCSLHRVNVDSVLEVWLCVWMRASESVKSIGGESMLATVS